MGKECQMTLETSFWLFSDAAGVTGDAFRSPRVAGELAISSFIVSVYVQTQFCMFVLSLSYIKQVLWHGEIVSPRL